MGEIVDVRMTFSDYIDLPEDGRRYEVLEGQLMMSPAPDFRHQRVVSNLDRHLGNWAAAEPARGVWVPAPFDVVMADDSIVQPDLVYIERAHLNRIVGGRLHGVPDIAIEVFHAKGAQRDTVAKHQLYAKFDVPEYWLVDLDAEQIEVLVLASGHYTRHSRVRGRERMVSPRLALLELVVEDVFKVS